MLPVPKKRRLRASKACIPCRSRKVRCNLQQPCSTCQKRGHVSLCTYESAPKRRRSVVFDYTSDSNTVQLSSPARSYVVPVESQEPPAAPKPARNSSHSNLGGIAELIANLDVERKDIVENDHQTDEKILLGRHSPAVFFQSIVAADDKSILDSCSSLAAAFCLSNRTVVHPFATLWANTTIEKLFDALPPNQACTGYYRVYRDTVHPLFSLLLDTTEFERRLCDLLQRRGSANFPHRSLHSPDSMSWQSWYGIFFAVMAAGCQFSDLAATERQLTTRVLVACSFESLRLSNFYVRPTVEAVQTMLILLNVVQNDSNPAVAWSLLGLTARQAQALGLHLPINDMHNEKPSQQNMHPLWRRIVHQDSVLSYAFSRLPITGADYDFVNPFFQCSYQDTIHSITILLLHWQMKTFRLKDGEILHSQLDEFHRHLDAVESSADPAFKDSTTFSSLQEHLQYLVYNILLAHIRAELDRAGTLAKDANLDSRAKSFDSMVNYLCNVVGNFLTLNKLTNLGLMSWEILHRVVGSALLLGAIYRKTKVPDTRNLLVKFIASLSDADSRFVGHDELQTATDATDGEEDVATSYRNSLAVLKRLVVEESSLL